ncbi:MAG: polysaccharide deacetylase family protein, partial [Planctomycetaceae bacterium]|nr:polysaccharide deacetylase family protein [Planctomycetaceae bacterium]
NKQPIDAVLPDNAVFISFDDGWRNNLTLAAPLLEKYGIHATAFLTTDYIGTVNSLFWALEMLELLDSSSEDSAVLSGITHSLPVHNPTERTAAAVEIVAKAKRVSQQDRETLLQELQSKTVFALSESWKKELYEFLSWDEVRMLRQKGWSIGCHTLSHPILSMLPTAELTKELKESKEKIEAELGEPCETLSYPHGGANDYNEETIAVAKQLGFRTAFTLEHRRSAETFDPMRIHRICVTRDLTLNSFRAIISGARGM